MSFNSLQTTSVTEVVKIKFGHKWVINYFKDIVREPGQFISSSNFPSDSKEDDVWCLTLYPNGNSKENEGYLSIYLTLVTSRKGVENVKYQISVIDSNDSAEIEMTSASDNFTSLKPSWGWSSFVKRAVLFEENSELLPNGTLTIICEIEKAAAIVTRKRQTPIHIPNSTLVDELAFIVQNEKFGDVLFKIGRSKLRASKTILAARSPVFAGMFSHETMKENQKNEVIIKDVKKDVFLELLYFMYTDTAPNIEEMPEELLAAADRYQLDRLKIMCEKVLYEKISIDNVVEIFVLSDMYNAEKLRNGTLKFMKGREVELLKTNGYKSLQESNKHRAWRLCEMLLIEEDMLTPKISLTK